MQKELTLSQATISQLKIFEAVVRHGNFTRAGKEIFLSQPAVCLQIKRLSESLGVPLFEKVGHQQSLTEAGKKLFTTCREIFDSMARFEKQLAAFKLLEEGTLHLAGFTTTKYITSFLLRDFCQLYPGIDICFQLDNHYSLMERLAKNLDDLYFLSKIPSNLDVICHQFIDDDLVVVASVNHPLAKEKNIPIKCIESENLIMRETGSATRSLVQNKFLEMGVDARVRLEIGSDESIKEAISCGWGISILSRHCLISEPVNSVLTILDVENFPIKRQWYIAYPAHKQLSFIANTYLKYLLQITAHLQAQIESYRQQNYCDTCTA